MVQRGILTTARHFAAEILVMNQGPIVEQGSPDDVILRPSTRTPGPSRMPHPIRCAPRTR
jgi:ABC-type antimicrobial peptide transport system ATPase subunit